ncbi:hypothetical protein [Botrytis cinerea hypovirulence-associated DNA virus 1]|nr:hypothetical protein [Botrytis cinerea hypovirulence-associated DNA virus 1]
MHTNSHWNFHQHQFTKFNFTFYITHHNMSSTPSETSVEEFPIYDEDEITWNIDEQYSARQGPSPSYQREDYETDSAYDAAHFHCDWRAPSPLREIRSTSARPVKKIFEYFDSRTSCDYRNVQLPDDTWAGWSIPGGLEAIFPYLTTSSGYFDNWILVPDIGYGGPNWAMHYRHFTAIREDRLVVVCVVDPACVRSHVNLADIFDMDDQFLPEYCSWCYLQHGAYDCPWKHSVDGNVFVPSRVLRRRDTLRYNSVYSGVRYVTSRSLGGRN